MILHCVGLHYRTAPIRVREVVALDDEGKRQLLARCGRSPALGAGQAEELTVLSTCHRAELYALLATDSPDPLRTMLSESSGLDESVMAPHLYHLKAVDAARHLLRVAAGLDSLVVGEPQILGQVAQAHLLARQLGAAGPVLTRLFQTAIHAGKRARAETTISHNPATVSSLAVALAAREVGSLAAAQVLVIGAGEMAELVVESLRKRQVSSISVINRTEARAQELAARWHARPHAFADLDAALHQADIVISSTGSAHTVVHPEVVRRALQGRPGRSMVFIDIALPRDVDPEVGSLPGVRLYDLDRLQAQVADSIDLRARQVPQVEALVEEELAGISSWLNGLSLTPILAAVHQKADAIRQRELAVLLRRLPSLEEREVRRIEAFSRALVKKLLHEPTMFLKRESRNGDGARSAEVARELFGLTDVGMAKDGRKTPPGDTQ
ncbi:MAG: glutamyl-tRNA reductase [Anaerolineales bacterium]